MTWIVSGLRRLLALRPGPPRSHPRLEFRATPAGKIQISRNGRLPHVYDAVVAATLQEWSGHFACIALRDGTECVILDGRELGRYERIRDRKLLRHADRIGYVTVSGEGLRIFTNGKRWRGTFDEVSHISFSPEGELYACVVFSHAAGERYTYVDGSGSRSFWAGPRHLLRDGKTLGFAGVPQEPVFWKGHCVWISSLGEGYDPERSRLVDERGRDAWETRCLDQPMRLELKDDDLLVVTGVDYEYDDDRGRLLPFSARIEYKLTESAQGVVLEEVAGSYCAWRDD